MVMKRLSPCVHLAVSDNLRVLVEMKRKVRNLCHVEEGAKLAGFGDLGGNNPSFLKPCNTILCFFWALQELFCDLASSDQFGSKRISVNDMNFWRQGIFKAAVFGCEPVKLTGGFAVYEKVS